MHHLFSLIVTYAEGDYSHAFKDQFYLTFMDKMDTERGQRR